MTLVLQWLRVHIEGIHSKRLLCRMDLINKHNLWDVVWLSLTLRVLLHNIVLFARFSFNAADTERVYGIWWFICKAIISRSVCQLRCILRIGQIFSSFVFYSSLTRWKQFDFAITHVSYRPSLSILGTSLQLVLNLRSTWCNAYML